MKSSFEFPTYIDFLLILSCGGPLSRSILTVYVRRKVIAAISTTTCSKPLINFILN